MCSRAIQFIAGLASVGLGALSSHAAESYDVVIYGGTSAGVAAAVQTARMGRTAVIVHPGRHLGGLTSGGLGATDIGNKAAIGGIAREFYRRLGAHYGKEEAWTFEPHVAENTYKAMIEEAHIPIIYTNASTCTGAYRWTPGGSPPS